MATKKIKVKTKSSRGPQIVAFLLVVILISLGVRQYFIAEEELAKLHRDVFNTTDAVSNYSFSITDLAIIVETKLSSVASPGLPPFNYRITHEIGLTSHVGVMELKLSENDLLAETITADVKVQFMFESDHIYLMNPSLVYKTLDKEVTFGDISGKIHYTGDAALVFEKFEYKDPKFEVVLSQIALTASRKELKFNISAGAMSLNGVEISSPTGSFKLGEKSSYVFRGKFGKEPVEYNFVTQNKVTSGTAKLPVGLLDAAFDSTLEYTFHDDQERVEALNNAKDSLIFEITKKPKKDELKKNILATFTKAKNIKRDDKFYTITVVDGDVIAEQEKKAANQKLIDETIAGWSKLDKEKMIEEAFFALMLGDNIQLQAAQEMTKTLQKTLAKDPLFLSLKAMASVRNKEIDRHKYKDDAVSVIKDALFEVEKVLPEHKFTYLLKLKIAEIINNKETFDELAAKLVASETNPELKNIFQAYQFQHADPRKALTFLPEGKYPGFKSHLFSHANDLVNQEAALKELASSKKATLLDLADYGELLVKQSRFQEALGIMEECLKDANSKNRCHDIREEAVMNLVFEEFKTKPDVAFEMARSLLYQRPAGRHAHYAIGWMYNQKQNVSKSMEHFSISCAFGSQLACLSAGDGFAFKLNDSRNAFYMYEIACDLSSSSGCIKAGMRAEQFNLREKANNYFSKACNDLKDTNGCYQFARNLQKMNKSKEDVAVYLDKACKEIKPACQYANVVKSGKQFLIPESP